MKASPGDGGPVAATATTEDVAAAAVAPVAAPVPFVGLELDEPTSLALVAAVARFLPGGDLEGAEPSRYVVLLSVDGVAAVQRRELAGRDLRADGLRTLGRTVERRRVLPGALLLVGLGDGEPTVHALDVGALRRDRRAAS